MRYLIFLALVAGVAWAWWSSTPLETSDGAGGAVVYRRLFGRVVGVESDRDGDGTAEVVTRYSYSEPFAGRLDPAQGCKDWTRHTEDRNADGRPDTWHRAVGETASGECRWRFDADVDGDGEIDWWLEVDDKSEAYTKLMSLRGH
jgi:hypothetical protein